MIFASKIQCFRPPIKHDSSVNSAHFRLRLARNLQYSNAHHLACRSIIGGVDRKLGNVSYYHNTSTLTCPFHNGRSETSVVKLSDFCDIVWLYQTVFKIFSRFQNFLAGNLVPYFINVNYTNSKNALFGQLFGSMEVLRIVALNYYQPRRERYFLILHCQRNRTYLEV